MKKNENDMVGTLRTQAINYIQQKIVDGSFKPGDRIVESRLAQELNMSQAPVREAILELSSMGFLERRPFSGSFVRKLETKDLEDYYSTRAYLEKLAAELATENATEEILKKMRFLLFEMQECTDRIAFVVIDHQFHESIFDAAGNTALKRAWVSIAALEQTTLSTQISSQSLPELTESHRILYQLIEARDAKAASAEIYRHIQNFGNEVLHYFQEQAENGFGKNTSI